VRAILAQVKRLAAEYYQLTGKPLCVTGEKWAETGFPKRDCAGSGAQR
jgi:hypothetical protein